jgi:hypothetical protein
VLEGLYGGVQLGNLSWKVSAVRSDLCTCGWGGGGGGVRVGGGHVRICTIEQSDFKTQYGSKLNEMRIEGYSCQGGKRG